MKKHVILFAALAALSACGGGVISREMPVGNAHVPEPKKPVELSRYLGKWYEIYRYENSFEEGCTHVTATYSALDDGKIGVINRCLKNGKEDIADGKAIIVKDSDNTKLKVSFFGPFYVGDYWVLDRAADYSWAIVGEPSGKYLWVLSRTPTLPAKREKAVMSRLEQLGYDKTPLHKTVQ